jgi:sec-independent protein translocase protein TatC
MRNKDRSGLSEDMFAETRMTFGEHLEELRLHLWRAIAGFGVALFLSFFIGREVLAFIAAPVEEQLSKFYERRVKKVQAELQEGDNSKWNSVNAAKEMEVAVRRGQLAQALGQKPLANGDDDDWVDLTLRIQPLSLAIALHESEMVVGRRPVLSTLNVQEAFMVYFKVCMYSGIVLASPWIFWQIWAFIAAGLYPQEKRYVQVYLPFSLGLFLAGVFVCQFLVIPRAVEALLWFNEWIGLEPDLRLNEWLGFAIMMPLVFGVSFQTPLVMLFLERLGILNIETYRSKRRLAWFVMAVFAAVITPSTDAVSMLFLWVPMSALYELGILLAHMSPRPPDLDIDVPESEEMVEV